MTYSAYLFDLDGTLLDSIDLIVESFHYTRHEHFGDRLPDAHYRAAIGTPLRAIFSAMARSDAEAEAMVRTYVDYNMKIHDARVRPYPGVVDVVRTLGARGTRLAVVTSKIHDNAVRGLVVCALHTEFEVVIGSDDVARGKPDPEPVLAALTRLDVPADRAVLVGDSPHDVEAGQRAGVATAAVTWGPFARDVLRASGPTHLVDAPEELLALSG
jgi:pyrophosphatase PpaX